MNFFFRYRDKFRMTTIFSSIFFNFFMIYAAWADDDNAWTTTYIIACIALVCAIVCHFTQSQSKNSKI